GGAQRGGRVPDVGDGHRGRLAGQQRADPAGRVGGAGDRGGPPARGRGGAGAAGGLSAGRALAATTSTATAATTAPARPRLEPCRSPALGARSWGALSAGRRLGSWSAGR